MDTDQARELLATIAVQLGISLPGPTASQARADDARADSGADDAGAEEPGAERRYGT